MDALTGKAGELMLENIDRLEKNIVDQVKEAQLKLGFVKETMHLYYSLDTLNAVLGVAIGRPEELCRALSEACGFAAFDVHKGRIEVRVPPEFAEYVYHEVETPEFLSALIGAFQNNHHLQLPQLEELFSRFGKYTCRRMPEGADFDYALYFDDAGTDGYYYCIKMEMGHTIYHRFMKEDYIRLFL